MESTLHTITEAEPFTAKAAKLLTDEQRLELCWSLATNPAQGVELGSGIRKLRIGRKGAFRVVFWWYGPTDEQGVAPIYLLAIYPKSAQANLTNEQLQGGARRWLKADRFLYTADQQGGVSVSEVFDDIMTGLEQALEHAKGERELPSIQLEARAAREAVGLTQRQFADAFGLSLDAVRGWEQGRRNPSGAARALLTIIRNDPKAAVSAMQAKAS